MTPTQQLNSILSNNYENEDGDQFKIELLAGLNDSEIFELKAKLPNNHLPNDIEELLRLCKGFYFESFDEVNFDSFGDFGFESLFPNSIELAGDGFGNFWILDISHEGDWKSVYYVSHDPPVVVKQADNLSQFIRQIDEYGKDQINSVIHEVHEIVVFEIWNSNNDLKLKSKKESETHYTIELYIADLKQKGIKTGFSWGKFNAMNTIKRPTDEPIWLIERQIKPNFLKRLFSRSN